ncbi:MAG: hypothetical protein V2J10_12010 [Wenzhouxiangella sp.]|jgi:hypothetical protein|nr:hypothetical protein [Wenzhouxiangella sp.]
MSKKISEHSQERIDRMIADYVRGSLDEEETEALELQILENPELRARVEEQQLLQGGLIHAPVEVNAPVRGRWWPGYILAGGLGLALVMVTVWNVRLTGELEELRSPRSAVPVITLLEQRSVLETPSSIEAATGEGPALIEIDVSADGDQPFDVALISAGRSYRWQGLSPDERGYLTVYVPSLETLERLTVTATQSERVREFEVP